MTTRTLLIIGFIIFFKSTFLLAQSKSVEDWKTWDSERNISQYLTTSFQQNNLGLTTRDKLLIKSDFTDEQNVRHVKLQQYYNNIQVEEATYILHEHPTKGTSSNGILIYNQSQES